MSEKAASERNLEGYDFWFRSEREGLVRRDPDGRYAFLRGFGWVRVSSQAKTRRLERELGIPSRESRDLRLLQAAFPIHKRLESLEERSPNRRRAASGHWCRCRSGEAEQYMRRHFSPSRLTDPAYSLGALGWFSFLRLPPPVRHGPAPWRIDRKTQLDAQGAELEQLARTAHASEARIRGWIEQARAGAEQERNRINGIQERASVVLAATGVTTAGVLANAGILYGKEALAPLGWRISVGILLILASILLAAAAGWALQASMIIFDRALPNAVWQIRHRIESIPKSEEPRRILAATLLANRRSEAIGDWKVRRLKNARLFFGLAVAAVVLANVVFGIAVMVQ